MLYFTTLLFLGLLFGIRKTFSNHYFSPSGFLILTWFIFIFLKWVVASDYFFSTEAMLLILLFVFSFLFGEFLMYIYIASPKSFILRNYINNVDLQYDLSLFLKKKTSLRFKFVLISLGSLSLLGSALYLGFFVSYFGSVTNVLTAGWALRGALEEIKIPLLVRAILMLGYSAIILSLLYYIIYNKFKWYFFIPFLAMFIMGVTQAGRAGFMMIIFQVFIASFWHTIFNNNVKNIANTTFFNSPEFKLIKSSFRLVLFVAIIFVGGDMLRSQNFSFDSQVVGQGLTSFKTYLFGGIAAFTTYLKEVQFVELGLGRYTFSSLYDLLGIHKNTLGIYTNYLRISEIDFKADTNIFTAFRQFMDDFGIIGTVFLMMILGAVSYIYFLKAIKGDIASIALMIVFYTIIFHTPLLAITVHNSVLISAILPYFAIKFIKLNL